MPISHIVERGLVPFPAFTGERIYMRAFTKKRGLPAELARWQPTVDAMLAGIDTDGPIYLMVDQAKVAAAGLHRRAGVHVDGAWMPELGGHRHEHTPSPLPRPLAESEALILASDVLGCSALVGGYVGSPAGDGDCAHLDLSGLKRVELTPGVAWAGDARHLLHESIPLSQTACRTVVRLNVRGWLPH